MAELHPLLCWLATVYVAALGGGSAALLIRAWARRGGRAPSAAESAGRAFLPLAAALLVPPAAALLPADVGLPAAWHLVWHQWERVLHASPLAHGALHAANLVLVLLALTGLARAVHYLSGAAALTAALRSAAGRSEGGAAPVYVVPSPQPACFAAGFLRPGIYVTTGLLERLSERDVEAMLAHEQAHLRRKDRQAATLLALFQLLVPFPGAVALRRDWERAAELACDAEAARSVRSPHDVAAALVRVARLTGPCPVPAASSFRGTGDGPEESAREIESRVRALLARPAAGAGARSRALLLLPPAGLALLLGGRAWIRHLVDLFVHH